MNEVFAPAATGSPFDGLPNHLNPVLPGGIPEAPGAGDATASLSPFKEAIDIEDVIKNLVLDRPLKLSIPNRDKYPDFEFRIINSIPQEIADAHNKGFKEVSDPDLAGLFTDLVAGTDKNGKAFRPMLMARPKAVGDIVRKQQQRQLQSLYAGMDPANKELGGKYTNVEDKKSGTYGKFDGAGMKIRIG